MKPPDEQCFYVFLKNPLSSLRIISIPSIRMGILCIRRKGGSLKQNVTNLFCLKTRNGLMKHKASFCDQTVEHMFFIDNQTISQSNLWT